MYFLVRVNVVRTFKFSRIGYDNCAGLLKVVERRGHFAALGVAKRRGSCQEEMQVIFRLSVI